MVALTQSQQVVDEDGQLVLRFKEWAYLNAEGVSQLHAQPMENM
jgi:hypothetical protein